MKTQGVRLLDVFALGPFMIWAGARDKTMPNWARALMTFSGFATMYYNGVNYLQQQKGRP